SFLNLEPNHHRRRPLTCVTSAHAVFLGGGPMGQSRPFRATALVVEDDAMQREMLAVLLEESQYDVIQCESAEAAELVLDRVGTTLSLLMTDVNLAGRMTGAELAAVARSRHPLLV